MFSNQPPQPVPNAMTEDDMLQAAISASLLDMKIEEPKAADQEVPEPEIP